MRPVHLTLAILLAVVAFAVCGPDVQASARLGCNGPAACSPPDLALDLGCSEPAATCGGDERSIVGNRRWFPGKGVLKGLRDWNPRFRPQGRFGRCG